MTFKVESNIPVPPKNRYTLYPLKSMAKGDSFFVGLLEEMGADDDAAKKRLRTRLSVAARKFGVGGATVREVKEGGKRGFRVWRLK